MALYSIKDAEEQADKLSIHDVSRFAAESTGVANLVADYTRARMLISTMLTAHQVQTDYIERLERMNDKLLGMNDV